MRMLLAVLALLVAQAWWAHADYAAASYDQSGKASLRLAGASQPERQRHAEAGRRPKVEWKGSSTRRSYKSPTRRAAEEAAQRASEEETERRLDAIITKQLLRDADRH